jgi:hypothetical protein
MTDHIGLSTQADMIQAEPLAMIMDGAKVMNMPFINMKPDINVLTRRPASLRA